MRTALVTGSAGFIGYFTCKRLIKAGFRVIGLDAMTDYYDVTLKERRHAMLLQGPNFSAVNARIEEPDMLKSLMRDEQVDVVVHLAAQAGVRYSIEDPKSYVQANLLGAYELLEAARAHPPEHLLMASTSSVYGANTKMPYKETDKVDTQMSFYAATKKANEAMAHSYAHLYDIPTTMFRFFTVYGPWGRPDMAPIRFAKAIYANEPIDVYNHGKMKRDFTYVEDLSEGILRLIDAAPVRPASEEYIEDGDSLSAVAPFRQVNIGNAEPVPLMEFIAAMEAAIGVEAKKNYLDIQPGDVPATWADITLLKRLTDYAPSTDVRAGAEKFVEWYKQYYKQG